FDQRHQQIAGLSDKSTGGAKQQSPPNGNGRKNDFHHESARQTGSQEAGNGTFDGLVGRDVWHQFSVTKKFAAKKSERIAKKKDQHEKKKPHKSRRQKYEAHREHGQENAIKQAEGSHADGGQKIFIGDAIARHPKRARQIKTDGDAKGEGTMLRPLQT